MIPEQRQKHTFRHPLSPIECCGGPPSLSTGRQCILEEPAIVIFNEITIYIQGTKTRSTEQPAE